MTDRGATVVPLADLSGVFRAHRTLLDRLDPEGSGGLRDEHVSRPSRLPLWTVGHVLAHVIHNAQSMVRLVEAAGEGRVGIQYPGGAAERTELIERDADATAGELVDLLRVAIDRLETAWHEDDAWAGRAEMASGAVVPITDLPLRRWREVEVHMGDLGIVELGCDGPQCWSQEYIRRDVRVLTMQWSSRGSMGMSALPPAIVRLDDRSRLAWLLGRLEVEGFGPAGLV